MKLWRMKVITLDRDGLARASKELTEVVLASGFRPTHLLAIANGGVHVAREMANHLSLDGAPVVVPARRRSSEWKRGFHATALLRRLPYFITDRLRILEAQVLGQRRKPGTSDLFEPLPREVSEILCSIRSPAPIRLLVVDDAVDSGRTLRRIVDGLRCAQDSGGEMRTAVITVTGTHPLIQPDFHLYDGVICRFPWSYDFRQ